MQDITSTLATSNPNQYITSTQVVVKASYLDMVDAVTLVFPEYYGRL